MRNVVLFLKKSNWKKTSEELGLPDARPSAVNQMSWESSQEIFQCLPVCMWHIGKGWKDTLGTCHVRTRSQAFIQPGKGGVTSFPQVLGLDWRNGGVSLHVLTNKIRTRTGNTKVRRPISKKILNLSQESELEMKSNSFRNAGAAAYYGVKGYADHFQVVVLQKEVMRKLPQEDQTRSN